MGRIAGPGAHLIVTKDDIHAPVQAILHAPVLAYQAAQLFSVKFPGNPIGMTVPVFEADAAENVRFLLTEAAPEIQSI